MMSAMERDLANRLKRAAAKVNNAVAERNDLIITAVRAKNSLRDIGEVVGLPHTTIAEIVKRPTGNPLHLVRSAAPNGTLYMVTGDVEPNSGFRLVDHEGNTYLTHDHRGSHPRNYEVTYVHQRADLDLRTVELD